MTDDKTTASSPEIVTKRIWRWDVATYRENGWDVEIGLLFALARIEVPELFIAFPKGDDFLKNIDKVDSEANDE